MIKECPFCGSIRIVETLKGYTSICLACESLLDDKSKPTIFDRITASPEVLAPHFVFLKAVIVTNINPQQQWISTLTVEVYPTKQEAIAATVAKLKEVCDE
jgi:hypothetical protein